MLIDEKRKEYIAKGAGELFAKRLAADIQIHKRPVGFVARKTMGNEHVRAFRGKNVIKTLDKYIQQWESDGTTVEFTPLALEKYDAILSGELDPKLHKD